MLSRISTQALAALAAGKNTTIERVNIKMPDIDLTKHMHEGKDIVSAQELLPCSNSVGWSAS